MIDQATAEGFKRSGPAGAGTLSTPGFQHGRPDQRPTPAGVPVDEVAGARRTNRTGWR